MTIAGLALLNPRPVVDSNSVSDTYSLNVAADSDNHAE